MTRDLNTRKTTGEFYTPIAIVDYMVEKIFEYLIDSNRINTLSFTKFQKSLLKLSFCDPAVGTGNFIAGILKQIWGELKKYEKTDLTRKSEVIRSFVRSNLYGVELDPKLLKICKTKMVELYPFLKLSDFKNLKVGNSIIGKDAYDILNEDVSELKPFSWTDAFPNTDKFDVIIGNPPYYNLKKMELLDDNVKLLYNYLKTSEKWKYKFRSASDIYYYFIFQSVDLLKTNGILSFIIPDYWLENKYADILREFLLDFQILEILKLGEINIFRDEGRWLKISTCVFTMEKKLPYQEIKVTIDVPRNLTRQMKLNKQRLSNNIFQVDQTELSKEKWILSPFVEEINKITKNQSLVTLDSCCKIAQGLSPGVKSVFVLSEDEIKKNQIEKNILVPFISNKNVRRWTLNVDQKTYSILPSRIEDLRDFPEARKYLNKNKDLLTAGPDRKRLLESGKIRWFDYSVYRNLSVFENTKTKIICPYRALHPKFSYDNKGYFGATDIYAIIPNDKEDIYPILGILNSSTFDFYYKQAGKTKGRMLEFFSDPLKKVLVPDSSVMCELTPKIEGILRIKEKNNDKSTSELKLLESEVNDEVAKMYNLDPSFIRKYSSKKNNKKFL